MTLDLRKNWGGRNDAIKYLVQIFITNVLIGAVVTKKSLEEVHYHLEDIGTIKRLTKSQKGWNEKESKQNRNENQAFPKGKAEEVFII